MLIGTTWYSNRMEPQTYWKIWSDALIHRIHMCVLEQIEREAEAEVAARFDSAGYQRDRSSTSK
jgi:hypothetical protein